MAGVQAEPGTPLDLSQIGDDAVAGLIRRLALSTDPIGDGASLVDRVRRFAMDDRISALRRVLSDTDPDSQSYSDAFQELIALEQAKRQEPERDDQ